MHDDGTILRVNTSSIPSIVTNLVNLSNNSQKLDPPFILYPQTYVPKGKSVIHIQVPASSQVHKTASTIFDSSNNGDFKITAAHQVAELYNRKRNHYTEGIIDAAVRFEDFEPQLFFKVRNLIKATTPITPG